MKKRGGSRCGRGRGEPGRRRETGRGGRSRRAASKRKQSYNEDDYYKSVGGDALVAKGRKARKAAEEQRIEAEQQARAQKRKAKKKRGGARSNPKPDPNPKAFVPTQAGVCLT